MKKPIYFVVGCVLLYFGFQDYSFLMVVLGCIFVGLTRLKEKVA